MPRHLFPGILPRAPAPNVILALWLRSTLLPSRRSFSTTIVLPVASTKKFTRTRKTGRPHYRKPNFTPEVEVPPSEEASLKERLLDFTSKGRLQPAFEIIKREIGPRGLDKSTTEIFSRCLHHAVRKTRPGKHTYQEEMVNQVRDWYMARHLPGSPAATQSLLGCYRDLGKLQDAADLWDWARSQHSRTRSDALSAHEMNSLPETRITTNYTSLRVYGTALPILAAAGRALEQTEQLYVEGLRRHAVAFNEYHLSPTAWQPQPEKPTILPGASITILDGLMAARFIYGKVVPGYLCLDTIFRLHPTQVPPSVLYNQSAERSLPEQVQAACMAAKGGRPPNSVYMRSLLHDLGDYAACLPPSKQVSDIFEIMLTLVRLMVATRPRTVPLEHVIDERLLQYLLTKLFSILPKQADNQTQLRTIVVAFEMQALFAAIGLEPHKLAFQSIASKHVSRHRKCLALSIAMAPLSTTFTTERFWALLEANAALGLSSSIQVAWALHHQDHGCDRDSLVKLARILAESAVATTEKGRGTGYASHIPSEIGETHREILQSAASEMIADPEELRDVTDNLMSEFTKHLQMSHSQRESIDGNHTDMLNRLEDHVKALANLVKEGCVANLHRFPIDRVSVFPAKKVAREWEQELYNKLVLGQPGSGSDNQIETIEYAAQVEQLESTMQSTPAEHYEPIERLESVQKADMTEPAEAAGQTAAARQAEPVGSIATIDEISQRDAVDGEESTNDWQTMRIEHTATTGIPLDELRFQNWCDMNYLMLEAQAFEDLYNEQVETKAASGEQMVHFKTLHMVAPWNDRESKRTQQLDMYWAAQHRIVPILEDKAMWFSAVEGLRTGSDVSAGL